MKSDFLITTALAAAMAFGSFSAASAGGTLGTTSALPASVAKTAKTAKLPPQPPVSPAVIYSGAQYATGGTALRNLPGGGITISGVVTPVQAAWLYFAVINNAPSPLKQAIVVTRNTPQGPNSTFKVTGKTIATGASPCWGGTQITVYKAVVPPSLVAPGNGAYGVKILAGTSGLTDGEDPWDLNVVYPLLEGASLIVVGTGSGSVAIYDAPPGSESGTITTLGIGFNYTLDTSAIASSLSSFARFDEVGADGQLGSSVSPTAGVAGETSTINGVGVAGPGNPDPNSDWDGITTGPLPQLWDDGGHDITGAAFTNPAALNVVVSASGDCLTTIANVVLFQ